MIIYVDADALPKIAKEIIIKTANRTKITAIFVANSLIALPPSPYIQCVVVGAGLDMADDHIASLVTNGDLVITSDIPLADSVIQKGAKVLTAHGDTMNSQNIKQKLNARDFMDAMRGTGVLSPKQMSQQKPYNDKDKKRFADGINRLTMQTQ